MTEPISILDSSLKVKEAVWCRGNAGVLPLHLRLPLNRPQCLVYTMCCEQNGVSGLLFCDAMTWRRTERGNDRGWKWPASIPVRLRVTPEALVSILCGLAGSHHHSAMATNGACSTVKLPSDHCD